MSGNARRQLDPSVATIKEVLGQLQLAIPAYQRPYTWSVKNVTQLLDDIDHFQSTGNHETGPVEYRIGTFILHRAQDQRADLAWDVVDGQQRYLSFALIAHALLALRDRAEIPSLREVEARLRNLTIPRRRDQRSESSLRTNALHLKQRLAAWQPEKLRDFADFFFNHCTVVILHVHDLDAAFQMFDSQNTRGRPLFPTDLLKAYHLRELNQVAQSREQIKRIVTRWESVSPEEINHVIAAVLFRIKMWSVNRRVPDRGFATGHVDLFKGIREDARGNGGYRWAHAVLLAKTAVDRFRQDNGTILRHGVIDELTFPFQITQPVINGEMFFQMVDHYVHQSRQAGIHTGNDSSRPDDAPADERLKGVLKILNTLPKGTGYRYVRELFDSLLIAYVDRFGWHDVEEAALILARYAYLLRARLERVQVRSVDMHARGEHPRIVEATGAATNPFAEIAQALHPHAALDRIATHPPETDRIPEPLRALYSDQGQTERPHG